MPRITKNPSFDESVRNVDPAEANVLVGVNYKIKNVAKVGTFDEDARNTDPTEALVIKNTNYKIKNVAKVGSFDEDARNVDPGEANVILNTNYKIKNAAKVGSFDEAARNTDPGEANVAVGVGYKILNAAKTGTLKPQLPKTRQTTSYVNYDDGYYQKGNPLTPRFVDNGDGTISDRVTRLMWVKQPELIIPGASLRADNKIQVAKGDWATGQVYAVGDLVRDAAGVNAVAMNISGASAASPCVLTVDNLQGIKTGQRVLINGIIGNMGTDILNGHYYYVLVNHTAKTLTLYTDAYCSTGVDTTGKTYTSGGTSIQNKFYVCSIAHTSGTFADDITALKWRESVWVASAANLTTPSAMAWTPTGGVADAINNCEALDYAGYSDWKLPNVNELQSLAHYGTYSPAIDATFFPNTKSISYWASTIYANNNANAWNVLFSIGVVGYYYRYIAYYVRPVRQY